MSEKDYTPYVGLATTFAEVLVVVQALTKRGLRGRLVVRRKPVAAAMSLRGFESGFGWYIEEEVT